MFRTIKAIKNDPPKIMYGLERLGLTNLMSDERYIRITYRLGFGRNLNLENPQAYTEKLNWCKLHWYSELAKQCADKYAVRQYVSDKGCSQYLNDLLGVWNSIDDIDVSSLPEKFVLKGTGGSGDVYICRDKSQFSMKEAKKVLSRYEHRPLWHKTKEWVYDGIPKRFIAERYIENETGSINDYKFFCFHGEPKFLFVGTDRATDVKFDFFDTKWNWLDVQNGHERQGGYQSQSILKKCLRLRENFRRTSRMSEWIFTKKKTESILAN